jgi:hypothetical protein
MMNSCLNSTKIASLSNIGLAVGDIEPLLASAKDIRLDQFYELADDIEILKYQLLLIINRCCGRRFILPLNSKQEDLTKKRKWVKKFKKEFFESCARERDKENSSDDEQIDYQHDMLEEVKSGVQRITKMMVAQTR